MDEAVTCVVDAKNRLGEVPVWDVAEQALYWVDIEGRLLQRLDAGDRQGRALGDAGADRLLRAP